MKRSIVTSGISYMIRIFICLYQLFKIVFDITFIGIMKLEFNL